MIQNKKVAFYTLGCKLNFSETSTIARNFEEAGLAKVNFEETPDFFVINTCSVTENADKKCKSLVNKAKRINPEGRVIIIGCYAQLKPEEISAIKGVDLVLGAEEKFNVVAYLDQIEAAEETIVAQESIKNTKDFIPSFSFGDRTRTFLKVQDGCDYFCTFCTIPLARGKSRNATVAETVKEAEKVAATNVKEIVLTGVNIGDFGQGEGENFFDLVRALDDVEGIERFRISSIEPNLLSNEIIEFVAQSKKFVPHFHIPLQSGNDELLQKMRRKYDVNLYTERIHKIREVMPDACIGVDVIVGFPGETDEKFMTTYNYINTLPVSYLHVFTYSERANTTAKKMKDAVPMHTRKERSKMLRILSQKKKRAFYDQQQGIQETVLWEGDNHEGMMHGFTSNYVKVKKPFVAEDTNTLEPIETIKIGRDGVMEIKPVNAGVHA